MHVMIEVILAPGASSDALLSPETQAETDARILSRPEAEKLGFSVVRSVDDESSRRFIIARRTDARRIQHRLNMLTEVVGYDEHDFDK